MVTFENTHVPATNMLGKEGDVSAVVTMYSNPVERLLSLSVCLPQGFRIAMNGLNGGRISIGKHWLCVCVLATIDHHTSP